MDLEGKVTRKIHIFRGSGNAFMIDVYILITLLRMGIIHFEIAAQFVHHDTRLHDCAYYM